MIRPVSGRKPLAGSSVVIRHCSAAPRRVIAVLGQPEVGQRLAGRDPHLGLHEVDVGDLLGHGVLDLDARVHLDEDVVAGRVEQELDGAGVAVADLGGEADGVGAHALADRRVEVRGRRDLDDLLVAALHRAVPLEQVDDVAGAVGEDLHLDVPRLDHGLLDEHRRVAERALGLAHAGLDRLAQVAGLVDPAHAAAAAAGDRLDEQRERHVPARTRRARRRPWTARPTRGSGTPAALAAAIARALLPVSVSTSAVGPMKVMPALAQASASWGFSDRKP